MDVLDRPPEEPEHHGPEAHQAAFRSLYQGLFLRDISLIRGAANVIEYSGLPLAAEIVDCAWQVEDALLDCEVEEEMKQDLIDDAFSSALQSQIYAGTPVDMLDISFFSFVLEKSNGWLRQELSPYVDKVKSVVKSEELDRAGLRQRRDHVLDIMQSLRVIRVLGRMIIVIG